MSETSAPLVRAAVIGVGFVGPHHVDAVRRGGYGEIVALAGADAAQLESRSRALGIARTTAEPAELFDDASIDVIHVCTPNVTHVPLAMAALEAGKHVVVEKPVALDSATARDLDVLARRVDRHAMVSFTYRGYPMVRRARELRETGELGDVRLIHGHYLQDWLATDADYNWRLEPAAGGASRAVADIGSHWLDTIVHVSGLRPLAVCAELATLIPFRQRPSTDAGTFSAAAGPTERVAIHSEDAAAILVRFADGAIGSCVISQVSPGRKNDFRIEVTGSKRTLAWRQEVPETIWLGARSRSELLQREPRASGAGVPDLPSGHPEGWGEALRDLFRPFYAAVASTRPPSELAGAAPYPTLADGADAVAFVEAVLESARIGGWVTLPAAASTVG